jgi:hypothetical protein
MCINVGGGYVENEYSFQVRILHVLRFISICDLFTDNMCNYEHIIYAVFVIQMEALKKVCAMFPRTSCLH